MRQSPNLCACISALPTATMSVKFDIEDFYAKLSRKSKIGLKWTKISCR